MKTIIRKLNVASMLKELERAKCILSDECLEVETLNEYSFRAKKESQYIVDVWVGYKKGRFKGYTILTWKDKIYYKNVLDIEKFIKQNYAKIHSVGKRNRRL